MLAAESVKLALVLCDGGEKDDTHKAENVLTNELSPSGSEFNTLYTGRVEWRRVSVFVCVCVCVCVCVYV